MDQKRMAAEKRDAKARARLARMRPGARANTLRARLGDSPAIHLADSIAPPSEEYSIKEEAVVEEKPKKKGRRKKK